MKSFFKRTRPLHVLCVAAGLTLVAGRRASAQTFSQTPTTVFTAASIGQSTLTIAQNSTSSVSPLINFSASGIIGYAYGSNSVRGIYYYRLGGSGTLLLLTDQYHAQTSSSTTLSEISSSGLIVGNQGRLGPDSADLGSDVLMSTNGGVISTVPVPNTVQGGGASYTFNDINTGSVGYSLKTAAGTDATFNYNTNAVGANGIIAGSVTRYAGATNPSQPNYPLGTDGFYYNPATSTSVAVGLTGTGYSYTPANLSGTGDLATYSTVTGTAGSGAAGYTQRYDGSGNLQGYDSWLYTPVTGTTQIGLSGLGSNYTYSDNTGTYENSQTFRTNTAGQIAGRSTIYTGASSTSTNGTDAWLYTPSSTPGIAATYGTSAVGTYTRLGLAVQASATQTLGNISPTGFRNTNIAFLQNNGTAAGTSTRVDSSGTNQGVAAWYFDGTANTEISPNDAVHPAAAGGGTYSSNTITALSSNGIVAGYAQRLTGTVSSSSTSLGQDAYIYNASEKKTIFINPVDAANSSNYEFSLIGVVAANGTAIGYYNTYSGSTSATITSSVLVAYTEATGAQPLATFSSAAAGFMTAFVDNFYVDSAGNIYGPNTYTNATGIVEYALVPEPTSLGLIGITSLGLLRRRRQ